MPPTKRTRKRRRRRVSISSSSSSSSASGTSASPSLSRSHRDIVFPHHPNGANFVPTASDPHHHPQASSSSASSSSNSDLSECEREDRVEAAAEDASDVEEYRARLHTNGVAGSPAPHSLGRGRSASVSSEDIRSRSTSPVIEPPFLARPDPIPTDDSALRARFKQFWMASVADAFQSDLNKLREEPTMNSDRLSLLIDSLAAGASVYQSKEEMELILPHEDRTRTESSN